MKDRMNIGLRLVMLCAFTLSMFYIIYSINKPEEAESLQAKAPTATVYYKDDAPVSYIDTSLDQYQHFLERMSVDIDTGYGYIRSIIVFPGQSENITVDSRGTVVSIPYEINTPRLKAFGHGNTTDYEWRGDTMTLNPDVFHYIKVGDDVYKIVKSTTIEKLNSGRITGAVFMQGVGGATYIGNDGSITVKPNTK